VLLDDELDDDADAVMLDEELTLLLLLVLLDETDFDVLLDDE